MIKLHKNFPIYLIKNFYVLDKDTKNFLIDIVLENKLRNHHGIGGSFKIDNDPENFFDNLYEKFLIISDYKFKTINLSPKNSRMCWSYCSNKYDHGFGIIHNHINTSTINSVYYLNIPSTVTEEKGSISFYLNDNIFTYKPNNYDLLIFPNYLDHKINNYEDDEEYRISINMEINSIETSLELFDRID